jgi:hypothetical protein
MGTNRRLETAVWRARILPIWAEYGPLFGPWNQWLAVHAETMIGSCEGWFPTYRTDGVARVTGSLVTLCSRLSGSQQLARITDAGANRTKIEIAIVLACIGKLKEADYVSVLVDVHVETSRSATKTWHRPHRPNDGINETCPYRRTHFSNREFEALRTAF